MVTLGTDVRTGRPVGLTDEQMTYHSLFLGLSGMGKSTAMLHLAQEAITDGHGIFILDPHATFVDKLLASIPEDRQDDVILFDLEDRDNPFALNVFSSDGTDDAETLILEAFQRIWDSSWGVNIETWLSAIAYVFSRNGGGTLADVPRFFTDRAYRASLLAALDPGDDTVGFIRMAEDRTGELKASEIDSTYKRVLRFLRNRTLRTIVGQDSSAFSFSEAMAHGKIVLFSLKGTEWVVSLLGTIILGRIVNAALNRKEHALPYCFVFVDEFQRFATSDLKRFIQQTRKYNVGLVMATQSLFVKEISEDIRQATLMVSTLVLFKLSDTDARQFARTFQAVALPKARPIPHPQPVDMLLRHAHPDARVRRAVDTFLRPIGQHAQRYGKESVYPGLLQTINAYFVALSEWRILLGSPQETSYVTAIALHLDSAVAIPTDPLSAYVATFCRIVPMADSGAALSTVLGTHQHLPQVARLFAAAPASNRRVMQAYTAFLTDLYMLRWLGGVLSHDPIPAEGIQEPTTVDIARALQHLERGTAVVRPVQGEYTIRTIDAPKRPTDTAMVAAIRARSQDLYCRPRAAVEAALRDQRQVMIAADMAQPAAPATRRMPRRTAPVAAIETEIVRRVPRQTG